MENPPSQKDIIIKCKLADMVKHFFKDDVILWHDPNLNSQENQQCMSQLGRLCQIQSFTEWEKASIFLQETKKICHVITSGTNGEAFVKEICSKESVYKINVFCRNKSYHSTWTENFPEKIFSVETKMEDIFDKIEQNLLEWYKQESSLKLNLPAFAPIFNDTHKSQMNNLHRFLKVIPNFTNREQAKSDFTALSSEIYSDIKNREIISDFEENYNEYNMEQILRWYTRESFLYKVTNNCLRIATSDSIQYCRLPLKDMQEAIKEQYHNKSKNFNGLLYRAAPLGEEEWQILKNNIGREIEMHGFLSTSKEKDIALKYLEIDSITKVFITIVVPKGPNEEEQGFAEVEEFSRYPQEKEVLFNVRSRFTVLETEEKSKELSCRHLVLLYGAQGFRRFVAEKDPTREILVPKNISCTHCKALNSEIDGKMMFTPLANPENSVYFCRKCLPNLTEYHAAPLLCVPLTHNPEFQIATIKGFELIKKDPKKIPFYGSQCSHCQAKKQEAFFLCTSCEKKKWCENCFEKTLDCFKQGHAVLLETSPFSFWCEKMSKKELNHLKIQNDSVIKDDNPFQQAEMYIESHEYEKAIEYYKTYLDQNETNGRDNNLATCYHNFGKILYVQREYEKALEYYLKSLDIRKFLYEENHPSIASSYKRMGMAYLDQGEFQKAFEYYLKSLEIRKFLNGENHPKVADLYKNIGAVYFYQGECQNALVYFQKSLDIALLTYEEDHPKTADCLYNIGMVYSNQGESKKAFEYLLKSLDITKSVYGENHPDTAQYYNNLGTAYGNYGESLMALSYFLKSLHITRFIYGENHPDTALSYNNIGAVYIEMGEPEKAVEYLLKSLDIKKSFYGENHQTIAQSYHNIGVIYENQRDSHRAIEYHLKFLNITKFIFGENHLKVADSYNSLGGVYESQREFHKALESYSRSLDITSLFYGENHPETAQSYHNIGVVYHTQGQFQKAIESYSKCLDIRKSVYGENHRKTADSYNNLGLVYRNHGDPQKALEYLFNSLRIRKSLHGEDHPETAQSYHNIGLVYQAQKEFEKAMEYYSRSLEIKISIYGENHPTTFDTQKNISYIASDTRNKQ